MSKALNCLVTALINILSLTRLRSTTVNPELLLWRCYLCSLTSRWAVFSLCLLIWVSADDLNWPTSALEEKIWQRKRFSKCTCNSKIVMLGLQFIRCPALLSNANGPINAQDLPALTRVRQLYDCAPLKFMQAFKVFFICRPVLWISSLSGLNVVSGALLKVILFMLRVSEEIFTLYLSEIKHWKV